MTDRPHVLFVTVDHWAASRFGYRGHPTVLTPTLDQLARSGTTFTRAYAECPVCMPARRCMMTGTPPRIHGDRHMPGTIEMRPELATLAGTFRAAGYQATAVGKIHVHPQRDRIGFDDVILSEEGRVQNGVVDDYEQFLAAQGHVGQYMAHCMSNNQYHVNPWHLPDELHVTNWATQELCRQIKRRDPKRPGFWYLGYVHPHPPLAPTRTYLDLYRDEPVAAPVMGSWAVDLQGLPPSLRGGRYDADRVYNGRREYALARRAYYALCTHIDHQLRLVIGTLREEHLLEDTVIVFTSDHGDMLGDHGLWAKRLYYEASACVPMILVAPGHKRVARDASDDRLVGHQDIMPTLLDLTGIPVPDTVTGRSMVGADRRATFFGEINNDGRATRMLHDGRHKLIYYALGNRCQLFDLENDPTEERDLADDPAHAAVRGALTEALITELNGGDEEAWVRQGTLVGLPDPGWQPGPSHPALGGQRGTHYPMPPVRE